MTVTTDTTKYTADSHYPTADGFVPAAIATVIIEAADAADVLDASVIAVGVSVLVEAADAADFFDAEVIAAEVPLGGGGYYPPLRPFPVEGVGFGILPELEGEAHGVVTLVGAGVGIVPSLVGEAAGSAGVAGRSAAQLVVRAAAIGTRGQAGAAVAVLKGLSVASAGVVGTRGSGSGTVVKLEGAANGRHDDDEAAMMAFLLAA